MNGQKNSQDATAVDKSFRTVTKNAVWSFRLILSLSRGDSLVYIFSIIYSAAVPTATTFFTAKVLDQVIAIVQNDIPLNTAMQLTSPFMSLLLLTIVLSFSVRIAGRLNSYSFSRIRKYHLRLFEQELQYKISRLDIAQFEDPQFSNTIRKATENIWKIEVFIERSVRTAADIIAAIISGVVTFSISPLLFFFIIVISIPNNLIFARFIKRIWSFYNETVEKRRKKWSLMWSLSDERSVPEYKVTKSNKYINDLSRRLTQELGDEEMEIYKERFRNDILTTLMNASVYILAPIHLLREAINGAITIGDFTFFQSKILDFSRDLDYVVGSLLEISDTASYITFVRHIIETDLVIKSGTRNIPKDTPPKIEFRNVWFKYPKSKNFALKNINATIEPGEEIAIVGENGAGKTTFIRLLLRFYDVTKGQILINDVPIQELSLDSYHQAIGSLFQEYNTYKTLSVKENIHVGDITKKRSKRKLLQAAKNADAHSFIKRLDKKYSQILSKDFTGGTRLSTGQWQKLALARMFYRDAPVLILDEPTASIDAEAEYKIFKRIYRFIKNKTVIIISHRFSTVRNAQKIYVLERGRIIESGTHAHLLKRKGKYANAFKLQAEGYTG